MGLVDSINACSSHDTYSVFGNGIRCGQCEVTFVRPFPACCDAKPNARIVVDVRGELLALVQRYSSRARKTFTCMRAPMKFTCMAAASLAARRRPGLRGAAPMRRPAAAAAPGAGVSVAAGGACFSGGWSGCELRGGFRGVLKRAYCPGQVRWVRGACKRWARTSRPRRVRTRDRTTRRA